MPNDRFVWSVQVRDYQTKAPLARVSVTAVEQTWDCKTRVMPRPAPAQDHDHRPPSIETYDCKGGRNHITRLTDAGGSVTFQLPHPQYEIAPIKQPDYIPTDFPDPSFRQGLRPPGKRREPHRLTDDDQPIRASKPLTRGSCA
jgi:hypothetical protein